MSGDIIGKTGSSYNPFRVYKKDYTAGSVVLGGHEPSSGSGSMYSVVVIPQ